MSEIVLFQSGSLSLKVQVSPDLNTVWLSSNQMAVLFQRDEKTIRKHVNNLFKDMELDKVNNTQKMRVDGVKQPVVFYNLDVVISVGYRVKSQHGVEFRRWATRVLHDYIMKGYAVNKKRLDQLDQAVKLMKRIGNCLDSDQVLDVVSTYSSALDLLDAYDHQTISKPKTSGPSVELTYDECRLFIDSMKFADSSALFGNEKDGSFKSALGAIYQSFGGKDLYQSVEEKAANLLYLVTKNHGFSDGNKRIAAGLFLYFLKRNNLLLREDGTKRIADHTLVALTVMIAESRPSEKEMMVNLVMNFLV